MLHLILMLNNNEDFNEKDPKFKVGDYVRFQNKEDVFTKVHAQNWTK